MKLFGQWIRITMVIKMENNFNCGERIKELRKKHSLSQERLALNAGITPAYLGLLERGKRNATVVTIERICGALGITLNEFFSKTDCSQKQDDIGEQIKSQLSGLSDDEKSAVLQLVKQVVHLKEM